MNLAQGNLTALLHWFQHPRNDYKFLCLFVAHGDADAALLATIYDNREIINEISGPGIIAFLFADHPLDALSLRTGRREGVAYYGRVLVPKSAGLPPLWLTGVNDAVRAWDRESVVEASRRMSLEIAHHFELDADHLPCILLLGKGNSDPFVVGASNRADITAFVDFLHDLAGLADTLPSPNEIDWSFRAIHRLLDDGSRRKARERVDKASTEVRHWSGVAADLLASVGVPRTDALALLDVNPPQRLWQVVGLAPDLSPGELAMAHARAIGEARSLSDFRYACRTLERALIERSHAQQRLHEVEEEVSRLALKWAKYDPPTVRQEVEALCAKHQPKLRKVAGTSHRSFKEHAEKLLMNGKTLVEILSLFETVHRLFAG